MRRAPLSRTTANLFFKVHSALRAEDGLHPDAALDELCKLLFAKIWSEQRASDPAAFSSRGGPDAARRLFAKSVASGLPGAITKSAMAAAFAAPLHLSDQALARALALLEPFCVSASALDIKGIAFQRVIATATRFGMGQYFTPEPVVDAIVAIVDPRPGERVLDPFCGSGRFLTVAATHARKRGTNDRSEFHGIEKSDRMIRIALTDHVLHDRAPVEFHLGDCLNPGPGKSRSIALESFDVVLTNPPFGSLIEPSDVRDDFELFGPHGGAPLEVLGLEQSLRFLEPGGRLAIVLPESILNTRQTQRVRDFILRVTDVLAVLSLPPQTFAPFDGVGKASVLVLRKRKARKSPAGRTVVAVAHEVGYDSTNRPVPRNDLPALARRVARALAGTDEADRHLADRHLAVVAASALRTNMSAFAAVVSHEHPRRGSVRLGDLCTGIFAGATPPRSSYRSHGLRILKVRDLTGEGLSWSPGERGFVDEHFGARRQRARIQVGDLLLTAAAHHPRYIGLKVDIVDEIPEAYRPAVLCVAELVCLRPDPERVDPFVLLMWLRSPAGYRTLQARVVGQTAHLYPRDVAEIRVPLAISTSHADFRDATAAYRRGLVLRARFKQEMKEAERRFRVSFAAHSRSRSASVVSRQLPA